MVVVCVYELFCGLVWLILVGWYLMSWVFSVC